MLNFFKFKIKWEFKNELYIFLVQCNTLSIIFMCQAVNWLWSISRSAGDNPGFKAASRQSTTISSHRDEQACCDAWTLLFMLCLPPYPVPFNRATFVLNHQTSICSQAMHSSVMISNNGIALRSVLLNISRTIDNKFHMPSGSRPRNGRNNEDHSAAAGGAVVLK